MNTQLKRTLLLAAAGGIVFAGCRALPVLRRTQIGTALPAAAVSAEESAVSSESAAETVAELPEASSAAESAPEPELQAASPEQEEPAGIINIESEGSKAMRSARLFQQDNSAAGHPIVDRHFGAQRGTLFFDLPAGRSATAPSGAMPICWRKAGSCRSLTSEPTERRWS